MAKTGRVERQDCFAYRGDKHWFCNALTVNTCFKCNFFKTKEQEQKDRQESAKKLGMVNYLNNRKTVSQQGLREARLDKGLSQKDAAKRLGVANYVLCNYENGVTRPQERTIQDMVKLYGVDRSKLYVEASDE